jgi:hypothetical protein
MSTPPEPPPPPEEPYEEPGTTAAYEPGHDLPGWPMTAQDAAPFLAKDIA